MRTPHTLWMQFCMAALLLIPAAALSAIHIVEPDGTGDFATIQEAVTAAAEEDTVLLADGTFTGDGNRDASYLGKALTIRSLNGDPANCIIDLEGSPGNEHRAFTFANGEGLGSRLRNVTIRNGYVGLYEGGGAISCDDTAPIITGVFFENCSASSGGAVWAVDGAHPYIGQCSFTDCTSRYDHGGAVYAADSYPQIMESCFEGNACAEKGGAIWSSFGNVDIAACVFVANTSLGDGPTIGGGAVHLQGTSTPFIDGCTFLRNTAVRGGAVIVHDSAGGSITRNTFAGNSAAWGTSVYLWMSAPWFDLNIFAFDEPGIDPVYCAEFSDPTFIRSCVFGNSSGDSLCGTSSGTVFEDPLFCDLAADDVTLHENSPCMPVNNPHGFLIGSCDMGCEPTAVQGHEMHWGEIKALYR